MSLDLCLEADSTLTISTLSNALANAGAWKIDHYPITSGGRPNNSSATIPLHKS